MFRYFPVFLLLLIGCDSSPNGQEQVQMIPEFKPANVTYQITGTPQTARISYTVDDSLISVPDSLGVIPFEFSFRAESRQLLRLVGNGDACTIADCDIVASILVDDEIYREIVIEDLVSGADDERGPVFTLSAWGNPEPLVRYSLFDYGESGLLRYKLPEGWQEAEISDGMENFVLFFSADAGFEAEMHIEHHSNGLGIASPNITVWQDSVTIRDRISTNYHPSQISSEPLKLKLPITGY